MSKKYDPIDVEHIFDGIDDKDIEDNISTAENTINTNIDSGLLDKDVSARLPNLRDGLALSFAAANKGNSRAATKLRKLTVICGRKLHMTTKPTGLQWQYIAGLKMMLILNLSKSYRMVVIAGLYASLSKITLD